MKWANTVLQSHPQTRGSYQVSGAVPRGCGGDTVPSLVTEHMSETHRQTEKKKDRDEAASPNTQKFPVEVRFENTTIVDIADFALCRNSHVIRQT